MMISLLTYEHITCVMILDSERLFVFSCDDVVTREGVMSL